MDLLPLLNFNWRDQSVRITVIATLVCADQCNEERTLLYRRQLPRMYALNKTKSHRTLRTTAPINDHHGGRTVEIQLIRGEPRFGVVMLDLSHRDRYGRSCMLVCRRVLCLRQSKRPRLVGLADDVGQICRQRHILAAPPSHHQVDDGLVGSVVVLESVGCASKSYELRKR